MPLQFIAGIILAIIDLLRMSLIIAVPAFLLALAGSFLHKKISKKFKLNWIQSAFIASYTIILALVLALYLVPYYAAFTESAAALGVPPEFMQVTPIDYAVAVFSTIIKNLLTALILTILLMPLLFLASFISEKLQTRFKMPKLANTFASVYLTAAIAWVIILFIFPWVINGIFELIYWSQF